MSSIRESMRERRPKVFPRKLEAERNTEKIVAQETEALAPVQPREQPSRQQAKQMKKASKSNAARKANREKNKERVQQGKKIVPDKGSVEVPSIWEKIAEPSMYEMFRETGSSGQTIDKFQKKRVITALLIASLGIPAGLFVHVWLYLAGPILGFAFYKMQLKGYKNMYQAWKFERAMNFSKFTRLVIPYMKAAGGNTALYTIFNKILRRTEKDADRKSLYKLMGEMGDDPSNIKPFLDYAERSSGSDMSYLFMSTIFDYQQSTSDVQVIDELGKMAGEDMMNAIDEIIAMKLKRFVMFPTKVVMSSFILVAGLGVALMLDNFKDLDLNGATAPMESSESSESPASSDAVAIPEDDAETEETPEDVTADVVNNIDWEREVSTIAANPDMTNEEKAIETTRLANEYAPSDSEVDAFAARIMPEFKSRLYKEALTNDDYVLKNLFMSKVLFEKLKVAPSSDMYILAEGMWENTFNMYSDGLATNNPAIIENEKIMDAALAALENA